MTAWMALLAALLDRAFGYPRTLTRAIGHPVMWMGALLDALERPLNQPDLPGARRRRNGWMALGVLLAATFLVTAALALRLRALPHGWVFEAVLAAPFIAHNQLDRSVAAVRDALGASLAQARAAVAHIVGRDTGELDESGVARGAIESLAENFSDGVVAPVFYLALFGLPGIALYKAINTADSMLGHRTERHAEFGRASAIVDDWANLLPARLTAGLIALAAALVPGFDGPGAWRAARRDARNHLSPNAGWPEAAMAGALGVSLGGPRAYRGDTVELAPMGDGRRDLDAADISRALALFRAANGVALLVLLVLAGLAALAFALG